MKRPPSSAYRRRLIRAREALELTPAQIAAELLTPRQTWQQWEHGTRRTPGIAVWAAERLVAEGTLPKRRRPA